MTEILDENVRRARFEAALARYPDVDRNGIDELVRWFKQEASARDIALIASNEAILESYRRFRADHIDPFTPKDVVQIVAILAVIGVAIVTIAWRTL